jgi:muconolactone D-isomerase
VLFLVQMSVQVPPGTDEQHVARLKETERERSLALQRRGVWLHLWRVVGRYANVSVFDVPSNDALHDVLAELPLYPYMAIEVTPLATHPSAYVEAGGNRGESTGLAEGPLEDESGSRAPMWSGGDSNP